MFIKSYLDHKNIYQKIVSSLLGVSHQIPKHNVQRVYMSFWSKASIIGENIDKYT